MPYFVVSFELTFINFEFNLKRMRSYLDWFSYKCMEIKANPKPDLLKSKREALGTETIGSSGA